MSIRSDGQVDENGVIQGFPGGMEKWRPIPGLPVDVAEEEPIAKTGLPNPIAEEDRPIAPESAMSRTDKLFQVIYRRLETSESENNAEGYVQASQDLLSTMVQEVRTNHGSSYGDLHHTMMEWATTMRWVVASNRDAIKGGSTVARRSNTVNNQFVPHGASSTFGRNPGDALHAENFGKVVVDYVMSRGAGYVTADRIPGKESSDLREYSTTQVETYIKGFHAKSPVFEKPVPPYSAPPRIP